MTSEVTALGLVRLWAPVMEPNVASARVAEKAGMLLEGVTPSHYVKGGVRMLALNFGLIRAQWAKR
jgi:RimJ/RimL family protein N-acetyltransferase